MNEYLSGEKLYGDDFTIDQIQDWYEKESEGYADLGSKIKSNYNYFYHALNEVHGFNKLKNKSFENVLGFGAAYGFEFDPIISKIKNLTIIEPSDNLLSEKIGNLIPKYVKPEINGTLKFESNSFDLITCYGTLHHIPNVSHIINELIRVLKPNGYLLIREPVISLGDWNFPRKGLTRNERGIPISIFEQIFRKEPVKIISKSFCLTSVSFFYNSTKKLLSKPIFAYKSFVIFDKILSLIFNGNIHYHAIKRRHRIAPTNVFYLVKKH